MSAPSVTEFSKQKRNPSGLHFLEDAALLPESCEETAPKKTNIYSNRLFCTTTVRTLDENSGRTLFPFFFGKNKMCPDNSWGGGWSFVTACSKEEHLQSLPCISPEHVYLYVCLLPCFTDVVQLQKLDSLY